MKFAQVLRKNIGVYSQYASYKTLKKLINLIEQCPRKVSSPNAGHYAADLWWYDTSTKKLGAQVENSLPPEEISFIKNLEDEIQRVRRLYSSKRVELEDMLEDVFRRIAGRFELQKIYSDVELIGEGLVALEMYTRQTQTMFYKILKKHDRRTSFVKIGPMMMVRLEQEDWWKPKFDTLLIGINDAYAEVREMERKQRGEEILNASDQQDVETFERKTRKFFVRPEDIMQVKVKVMRHLPLDIFNRKKNKKGRDGVQSSYLESIKNYQDYSIISSVYLDNEDRTMYHERIPGIETERGNLIRVRWYGEHVNPPQYVYMERKTRRPVGLYTIDSAIKERFLLKSANVMDYMKGNWTTEKKMENAVIRQRMTREQADKLKLTSFDIQDEIVSKQLMSAVRTVCRRSAYQQGKDQTLRISLDTNLHMTDELAGLPRDSMGEFKNWYRDDQSPIPASDVCNFPFAVLEIKVQQQPPKWVDELMTSGLIMYAERFSKFLFGTIQLNPDQVRFVPYWYEKTILLEENPSAYWPESTKKSTEQGTVAATDEEEERSAFAWMDQDEATLLPIQQPSIIPLLTPPPSSSNPVKPAPTQAELKPATKSDSVLTVDIKSIVSVMAADEGRKTQPNNSRRNTTSKEDPELELLIVNPTETPAAKAVTANGSMKKASVSIATVNKPAPVREEKQVFRRMSTAPAIIPKKLQDKDAQRTAKTFFANERTLLQWVNTVTFLSLTGLTLLNTGTQVGKVTGTMLVGVTVCFALYALFQFRRRLDGLQNNDRIGNFADKYGPFVLVLIFCAVLIFTVVFFVVIQ